MQSIISWASEFNADSWTALAIDAVLKSTVLLILAAAFAGLMRRASAAVRHRTWCLTFAGLLLLPLLSYALPAWRIPVLPPVAEPEPEAVVEAQVFAQQSELQIEPVAVPELNAELIAIDPALMEQGQWSNQQQLDIFEGDASTLALDAPVNLNLDQAELASAPIEMQDAEEPSRSLFWSLPVLSLWALGSLLVVAPLVLGVLHSILLGVRSSRVTDTSWTGLLQELSGRLQLRRRVTLLETRRPVIPMTWGVMRPVVLVPESAQQWPERLRRFVLLHELAHVKRWDVPFQLLGRLACAVYWFHPLAWYALRRLRIERELACDDCVVTTGERPSEYAEQLVLIARACRPAGLASVGVAMARTSHLEGRIRALFDKARSHVPLSARAARVLTLAAALLVTTVAVVRPSNREPEPSDLDDAAVVARETASGEPEAEDIVTAIDATAETVANEVNVFRGRVLNPDGQPVSGAKLQLIPNAYLRGSEEDAAPIDLATSDASGEFEFRHEPDEFYGSVGETLLVTADGLAPYWQQFESLNADDELVVRLAADDVPVRGQILDLEGNPVAGVDVRVRFIRVVEEDDLDPFIESVKEDGGRNFRFERQLLKPPHIAATTTDDEGRFELHGIGRDRVVDLELSGTGIHHARVRVMTRDSDPVSPADQDQAARRQAMGQSPVYGATFSYLVQPSRPIRGIVVDAETKEPLSGIHIGTLEANASADTDEDGRFELDGCVKADDYRLLVSPGGNQPYINASIRVPDELGVEALEVTIEMTRGVVIKGRVTDADGKPVSASVSYWPIFANANLRPGIGSGEANAVGPFSSARTDRSGAFVATVLPGPGALVVSATRRDAYAPAHVDAAEFFGSRGLPYGRGYDGSLDDVLMIAASDDSSSFLPQSQFHAIELLNIDPDQTEPERTIKLQPKQNDARESADAIPARDGQSNKPMLALAAQQGKQAVSTGAENSAETITIRGTVHDPDGNPVAGAAVRAQTPLWAMLKPLVPEGWEPPVTESKADADGTFEISFATQPMGDLSHLNPQWAEIWKKTQIAASAPGFGPAWIVYEDIEQPAQPVTLKLVEDLPVHGRIVNLEGEPLAGETIRIGGPSAAENEDLSAWLAAINAGEPPWTVYKHTPRSIDPGLVGIPETVVSDSDGRFEIRGIGRERHLVLVVESENVAHQRVQVATREMEPVEAVLSTPPFEAVEPVFGARFTLAATPARIVTGAVRDAETGTPLSGVKVESYSLASRPRLGNNRVLKTVTDDDGRFRIVGMPKGAGNRLLVLPNDDQPYFMREIDVPNPSGLGPIDVTAELHRGIWITGRVTDAVTGEPVTARVHYLPYLTNPHAQAIPEFDDNGNAHGDQLRYQTKPDGTYRVVGLPGPAVIGVKSVLKSYPMGQGYSGIPGPKEGDGRYVSTYRNPVNPMAKWPTSMTYIDPQEDANDVAIDFQLQPGGSVAIHLVDPDGNPLSGVEVTGRLARHGWTETFDEPDLSAMNLGLDEERTVLFQHKDSGLGWVQRIKAAESESESVIVRLQPVATITGRLRTTLGDAITGMVIEATPLPGGDYARRLATVTSDAEGRFEYQLLPGAKYLVAGRGGGFDYVVLAREHTIKPGRKIDLGDLRIDEDGEVMNKPDGGDAAAGDPATREQNAATASTNEKQNRQANQQAPPERTYSGSVTDTDGKPLAGATVWLSLSTGEEEDETLLRTVATSEQNGAFRFTLDPEIRLAIDAAPSYWWLAKLVAVAPDHGIAWLPLPVFEDDPANTPQRDTWKAHLTSRIGAQRLESRSLQLRSAQQPVRGRLVDLEGRPLPGVTLRVESVMHPDVQLLLQAFQENSKDRYYEAVNATSVGGGITRSQLHQLFPPVTTDADGRFELSGIGNDQLVALTIHAPGVESRVIHVLGRSMKPASVPHWPGSTGSKDVFYGWNVAHAVGPSIPVEGVVKDFDTGEPVANAVVYVDRFFGEGSGADEGLLRLDTRHLRTTTDAQGRFRIDGMPPGIGHVLVAQPPKDEPYFTAQQSITLDAATSGVASVEIPVKQGIWIEGRVTDKNSGEPVRAYVDYVALPDNPNSIDKLGLSESFELFRFRTGQGGRYRVPGLPGPGVVMVRAIDDPGYPKAVGADAIEGYEENAAYFPGLKAPISNWNLLHRIEPKLDAESFTRDFELDAGQQVGGRVVGPDGNALSTFSVLGEIARVDFWQPHADGRFAVKAYDGQGPRQLFVKSADESLIGQVRLEGAPPQELVATLQPSVRVTGRLFAQETGFPAERYSLFCTSSSLGPFRIDDNCRTDDDGRFEIKGLLAGLTYEIQSAHARFSSGKNNFSIDLTDAKPGDVIDLGDVPEKNVPAKPAAMNRPRPETTTLATASPVTEPAIDAQHGCTVVGKVVDPDGQPVPGAVVAVSATRIRQEDTAQRASAADPGRLMGRPVNANDDSSRGIEILRETTADRMGEFELRVSGVSSQTHEAPQVIAWAEGHALAWHEINIDIPVFRATLTVESEQLIELAFFDLEGQPAVGVSPEITDVMVRGVTQPRASLSLPEFASVPSSLFGNLSTDVHGRITIRHLAGTHGIHISIPGSDRFAPQKLALNTQQSERRGPADRTSRSPVKNSKPGKTTVFALAPAQIFDGRVMLG